MNTRRVQVSRDFDTLEEAQEFYRRAQEEPETFNHFEGECTIPDIYAREEHDACEMCITEGLEKTGKYAVVFTCRRGVFPDPTTGRRRRMFVCNHHSFHPHRSYVDAKTKRTKKDWKKVTDPLQPHLVKINRMPEQYPSQTRGALRAFLSSGAEYGVVPGVTAGRLQESIESLGLEGEIYAEQRSNETVVRRIKRD